MSLTVLTAVTGPWEATIVAGLEGVRPEVRVVRRCADVSELLAAAGAGLAQAALVSSDVRHLDREIVQRLVSAGVAVVGLADPADLEARPRLESLGVEHVVGADAAPADVALVLAAAVAAFAPAGRNGRTAPRSADPATADPADALAPLAQPAPPAVLEGPRGDGAGRVVAVWGTPGAPGRTTLAVTIAAEAAAAAGVETVLVDADVHAASVAQVLGVLDDAPGLAAAVRSATTGGLGVEQLARVAPYVSSRLRVLTGIARAARWPELRPSGFDVVIQRCRALADLTVIDLAHPVETDEEVTFDTAAPRRNAITLAALAVADEVVVVGSGDPVGLQRLVRSLQDLRDVVPGVRPRVVVTKVRASAVGRPPEQRVSEALLRYAGVDDAVLVPDDRSACDDALLQGRSLTEAAPGSPARRAMAALALELVGRAADPRARRGRRRAAGSRE